MSDDSDRTDTATRRHDDTIAGTGPGIPDDALTPGAELPTPPTDEEVAAAARRLGAPIALAQGDG